MRDIKRKWIKSILILIIIFILPSKSFGLAPIVLGNQPEEMTAEENCVSLMVAENTSSIILKQKNTTAQENLFGGMVRFMAALTALDY
jgi:hypothetical protein